MSDVPNLENKKLICPICSTELDATDNFCRHCGAATGHDDPNSNPSAAEIVNVHVVQETPPAGRRLSDNRTFVLIMLFLVLGPIALPLLWRGRAFTGRQKTLLTLVVIVLTIFVVWLTWYVLVHMVIEPLQELFGTVPGMKS